ncbi:CYTH domain-containing protein [Prochlorococcus marinus]|uniref:CYTH domain-containing protein n=1 Tax=Prochlorococcus marinus TaxID=1219 RepID=UPI0022B5AC10|nr:CYTH domain-containing protein [Prochlorococcus marinus]
MGIEIERRFLVKNEDWKSQVILSEDFSQAYLNSSLDEWTIRVRIIDNAKSYITLKSSLNRLVNYEFEYSIPNKDAIELIKLSNYKITKTRYHLKINKKDWVVDLFDGSNSSLKIAEIELSSESEEIQVPSWCGQEITGIKSLSNASLAKTPISELSIKDRIRPKES